MSLPKEVDGDVTKIDGYRLMAAREKESGKFIGFYAFTPKESYIRGAGSWITAKGSVLNKIDGAKLVEMRKSFINIFDKMDSKGEVPTDEKLKFFSTSGGPASWDTQEKAKAQANKSK